MVELASRKWQYTILGVVLAILLISAIAVTMVSINTKDIDQIETNVKKIKDVVMMWDWVLITGLINDVNAIKTQVSNCGGSGVVLDRGIMDQFDQLNLAIRKHRKTQLFDGCIVSNFDAQGGTYKLQSILPLKGASSGIRLPYVPKYDIYAGWDSVNEFYAVPFRGLYTLVYHYTTFLITNHTQIHSIVKNQQNNDAEELVHVQLVYNQQCVSTDSNVCTDSAESNTVSVDTYLEVGDVIYSRAYSIVTHPEQVGSDQGRLILTNQCGSNYLSIYYNQPDKELSV
jgi:hypothetical protein